MSPSSAGRAALSGRHVLVVEDEYSLADDIVRELSTLGARIVGPFGDLDEATAIVDRDTPIDVAVVDVNLHSEMVFPLARRLRARKIPFVVTTGYDRDALDAEFRHERILAKPLDVASVARELASMIG